MVKEGRRMPCGFGPDIEWIQENCDLVGRLGEWIGRLVRPWFVSYVARLECPEAEPASRAQSSNNLGRRVSTAKVGSGKVDREREIERGKVQVVVCPWLRCAGEASKRLSRRWVGKVDVQDQGQSQGQLSRSRSRSRSSSRSRSRQKTGEVRRCGTTKVRDRIELRQESAS